MQCKLTTKRGLVRGRDNSRAVSAISARRAVIYPAGPLQRANLPARRGSLMGHNRPSHPFETVKDMMYSNDRPGHSPSVGDAANVRRDYAVRQFCWYVFSVWCVNRQWCLRIGADK